MYSEKRTHFWLISTSIAVIFSLLVTVTAIADDLTPPEPGQGSPTEVSDLPISTVEPDFLDEANTSLDNDVELDVPNEVDEFDTDSSTILSDVQENLPDDTSVVVVVDAQIEPLATQQAANVFVTGDPIWCPEGASPVPGVSGCTASYGDLYSLIDDIYNSVIPEPSSNGIIWIMDGIDASSAGIYIDGAGLPIWSSFQLTLQGGWSGDAAGSIIGTSSFSVPVSITGWGNSISINQLTVEGSSSTGLEIETDGDVSMADVSANMNSGSGVEIYSLGNVTLTGTNEFNDNLYAGLFVDAGGNVDLENVHADGNDASGVEIVGAGDVSLVGAVLTNNTYSGLYIDAGGSLQVEDINASDNIGIGAELIGVGGVSMTGVNIFNNNQFTGLFVDAGGDVYIENMDASSNGGDGSELIGAGYVHLSGANSFNNNAYSGLLIVSGSDIISENISATGNSDVGVQLLAAGNVLLNGAFIFNNNVFSGLYVEAGGDVFAENINASDNDGAGAELISAGNVSLSGINVFSNNFYSGLYIDSGGNIDVENITANNNGGDGAGFVGTGVFFIRGANTFNNNVYSGIFVDVGGDIFAENILASNNGAGGTFGSGAEFFSLGSFFLSGANAFANNHSDGLFVNSVGDVVIENTDSVSNGGNGIVLVTNGNATLTCGDILGNADFAIDASMNGLLTLKGVNFGGDSGEIFTEGGLLLVSNNCFTYPEGVRINIPASEFDDDLGVKFLNGVDGQTINLDCEFYSGTHLTLSNGDGVYLPCPIVDNARLMRILEADLTHSLPDGSSYVSGMDILIVRDGLPVRALDVSDVVWFKDPGLTETAGYQALYWDGDDWVDVTSDIHPFMTMFFLIPDDMKNLDLSILYWDGLEWMELTDGARLDDGKIVRRVGRIGDENYFKAEVNFIGTFILVEKSGD